MLAAALAGAATVVALGVPAPDRLSGLVRTRAASRRRRAPAAAVPLVAGLAALLRSGPAAAVAVGLLVALGRRAVRAHTERQAHASERAGAAEALAALAAELRAGRAPPEALHVAAAAATGSTAAVLASAAGAAQVGADPAAALLRGAAGTVAPGALRGLAACWQVCGATGSSLAVAVDRVAVALRSEHEQRLAVASELAGPRATAVMLAGLPLAGIALAAGLGARPLHVLLHTPVGEACLAVGIGLDLLGLWWTGRLVSSVAGSP